MATITPALDSLEPIFIITKTPLGNLVFREAKDPPEGNFVLLAPSDVRQLIKELEALIT